MTEAIDQMLDELMATALHMEQCKEDGDTEAVRFKLVLHYTIKVPPLALPRSSSGSTPGTIRWHELLRTLLILDVTKEKLKPLQRSLIRQLLQPLIQNYQQVQLQIEDPKEYSTAEESSICLRSRVGHAAGMILATIQLR